MTRIINPRPKDPSVDNLQKMAMIIFLAKLVPGIKLKRQGSPKICYTIVSDDGKVNINLNLAKNTEVDGLLGQLLNYSYDKMDFVEDCPADDLELWHRVAKLSNAINLKLIKDDLNLISERHNILALEQSEYDKKIRDLKLPLQKYVYFTKSIPNIERHILCLTIGMLKSLEQRYVYQDGEELHIYLECVAVKFETFPMPDKEELSLIQSKYGVNWVYQHLVYPSNDKNRK